METSEKLKLIRKTENITQVKMAELIGCGYSTYQQYELGLRSPSGEILQKFCKKFPEYTLWLMTGKTSDDQIDPFIKQEKSNKTA